MPIYPTVWYVAYLDYVFSGVAISVLGIKLISMNYLPVEATFAVGHGIVVVDVTKVGTVGRLSVVEVGKKPVRSTQCIILLCIQLL